VSAPVIIIPARGGSKGIPRKNLCTVGGISLIGRAARTARAACRLLGSGRVVVDSDDEEILAEGRRWGAETPYVRPTALAGDSSSSDQVLKYALQQLGISSNDLRPVVLMQATSPLTPPEHVVDAITLFLRHGDPVESVCTPDHHPAWTHRLDGDSRLIPLLPEHAAIRRQDLPPVVRETGAVYVVSAADVLANRPLVQPGRTRSVRLDPRLAVDIDHEYDLAIADALARRSAAPVAVGNHMIADDGRCFIIAEAGVNHDGEVAEAHRLIDAAADIGADAVKFQTWSTELLCRPGAPKAEYQRQRDGARDDQFVMLKRLELPESTWSELVAHATERGILFLSTPDEIVSARLLVRLGVPALKIGSAELDNLPYLAQIGAFGLPVLLSTGMGTLPEVAAAIDALRAHGSGPIALFHAVSAYPAKLDDMNVRAIATLRAAFGVPVGLSDHCPGPEAALAAVGIGLPLWEKHLTCDRSRPGPDHAASLDPEEFARQIALVRGAQRGLGDGRKEPRGGELATRAVVRKRLYAARDLVAGSVLEAAACVALRGDRGLPVSSFYDVIGRRLKRALAAGESIEEGDLDG
jgi:N,N'-diacetyllegionaminate synthase